MHRQNENLHVREMILSVVLAVPPQRSAILALRRHKIKLPVLQLISVRSMSKKTACTPNISVYNRAQTRVSRRVSLPE
jgi:hypothetical protein